MIRLLFICIFSASIFSSCSFLESKKNKESDVNIFELIKTKQILLTNKANFKDHTLNGGSGFLIYYNDSIYAVTAKHLIQSGISGKVIVFEELKNSFLDWKMFSRSTKTIASDTVIIDIPNLDYNQILGGADILFLKLKDSKFNIKPLDIKLSEPQKDEKYFLIGCPYSESNCLQNIYPIDFVKNHGYFYTFTTKDDINLNGFSGSPIVDSNSNVVGVLISGMDKFLDATPINEIEKLNKNNK